MNSVSSDDPVGAADFRRALALIQHGERGDEAGMRVIVDDEVIPAGDIRGRVTPGPKPIGDPS
ncbi:hypothetical protein A5641_03360 [Mycobacterium sp. 1554424.7]|nr:hypothetical protein A5641_03360 [Mycobacterium sp. 1554424.7]